jgi:hypothetical protein
LPADHNITKPEFLIGPSPSWITPEKPAAWHWPRWRPAIAAPKSLAQNRLESFVLTALFQGFPAFAATARLLKLARHESPAAACCSSSMTHIRSHVGG